MVGSRILVCCSAAANALCAGGIFTFPVVSPALISVARLSQSQLTTIVLAGVMSQYPFAALTGRVIDRQGPSVCSLVASVLFVVAFGAFSLEVRQSPGGVGSSLSPPVSFHRLALCYLLAGLGTVFSFFSALFAASRIFPSHRGLAAGVTMAIFGISPLFLTITASSLFTDTTTGLVRVSSFMGFLALLTGVVNGIGAITLRPADCVVPCASKQNDGRNTEHESANESTSMLLPKNVFPTLKREDFSLRELLQDPDFWLLWLYCVLTLGPAEMVISNLGTIVLSLSTTPIPSLVDLGGSSVSYHVKLLSLSNTISRLVTGPLADMVVPHGRSHAQSTPNYLRQQPLSSRVMFLTGPAVLLCLTFLWTVYGSFSCQELWTLSVGIGVSYSAIFTVIPTLMSAVWGVNNHGRNFGIMMYAPFMGTPIFSYLYAFVADTHTQEHGQFCEGRRCWEATFWASSGATAVAAMLSLVLWKRWRGLV